MGEPRRCFKGEMQPHEPFWRFRNVNEGAEPEMELYGFISEYSWFEDEITPKMFKDDLYRVGQGGPITIRIDSPGGDVFAASVIRSTIVDYPGHVTTRIDGLCASAATFVALAGNKVMMQDTAFFMIHDPGALVWGTIEDLKAMLDILKTIKNGIIDAYTAKTKLDQEKLAKMMTDETWLSAKEAKAIGFVDEVIGGANDLMFSNLAGRAAITNALCNYRNVPAPLMELLDPAHVTPVIQSQAVIESPEAARLRAEVKFYIRRNNGPEKVS